MSSTLFLGDCLEVMKGLPNKSVDCFICDLPYGQLVGGGGAEKAKRKAAGSTDVVAGCPWDIKIDLAEFWRQVKRLCKDDHTPVLMFCNTRFGVDLINSNPDWFRYDLVWNKQKGVSFLLANKQPLRCHEMVYVFSKKGAYYKRIDEDSDKEAWVKPESGKLAGKVYGFSDNGKARVGTAGKRCSLSVLDIKKPASWQLAGTHPTEKPLDLYRWLLARYVPEGGTVLDPTAGSFNSVLVAKELGFHGIGIEKDRDFYWKAVAKM